VCAARQRTTRDWWQNAAGKFALYVSQLVVDECSAGDSSAASERLAVIQALPLLQTSNDVDALSTALIAAKAVPASEPRDAFHIAVSAVHGINYLLTWNFKHIANAALRGRIDRACRDGGFEPPVICTPDELSGIDDGT
jgi:predicted nucleic acid-binding protein